MAELRSILSSINTDNLDKSVEFSLAALLSYMVDEVENTTTKVQDTVSDFIVHHCRK